MGMQYFLREKLYHVTYTCRRFLEASVQTPAQATPIKI